MATEKAYSKLKKQFPNREIIHINTKNQKLDSKIKEEAKPICLIIGPEGDFTENERKQILNFKDLQSLKINNNILRSETAVISALSIINYFLNL